jgi:hypothetical protein
VAGRGEECLCQTMYVERTFSFYVRRVPPINLPLPHLLIMAAIGLY